MIHFVKNYMLMVGVSLLMILLFLLFAPDARSFANVATLLKQGIAPTILGWGVLFNIKAGNWDFGVGAEVLVAAIVGGNLAKLLNLGVVGVICCCVLVGLLAGGISGALYYLLRIPTIIISIAVMLIYESLCGILFDGKGVSLGLEYLVLGKFPGNILMFLLSFGIAYVLFFKREIGYHIKAVGSDIRVAENNGINVVRAKASAFMIAGLFAGLYAAVNLASSGVTRTVSAMGTMGTCFNAMMCVFIGLSIVGQGNIFAAIYFGAVIMQLIQMALMVFRIPTQYSQVVVAVFVILFMLLSTNAPDMKEAARRRRDKKKLKGVADLDTASCDRYNGI